MVRVKICGITNWRDARTSVDAGADALGFNFYVKSPRYITPADARAITRRLPRNVLTVGVFVNAPFRTTLKIARNVELNLLQLHGEESPEEVRRLGQYRPVLKAFRVHDGFKLNELARFREASAFLLDGFDSRLRGGTGLEGFAARTGLGRIRQRRHDPGGIGSSPPDAGVSDGTSADPIK